LLGELILTKNSLNLPSYGTINSTTDHPQPVKLPANRFRTNHLNSDGLS